MTGPALGLWSVVVVVFDWMRRLPLRPRLPAGGVRECRKAGVARGGRHGRRLLRVAEAGRPLQPKDYSPLYPLKKQ